MVVMETPTPKPETTMCIVKNVGVMSLVKDGDKFWLIREKVERSQDFSSEPEVWKTLRAGKIRWHKV
jgi:hypothetical protein